MGNQRAILSPGQTGNQVGLLQQQLCEIPAIREMIPGDEIKRQIFGPGTKKAVQVLQARYGFPSTGIAGRRTAGLVQNLHAVGPLSILQIRELNARLNIQAPNELITYLARLGINTLENIVDSGGIPREETLPVSPDHPAILALEAHADLSRLSPDIELNAKLIAQGFTRIYTIATMPRDSFVNTLAGQIDGALAAQLHAGAQAEVQVLDNILTERLVYSANRIKPPYTLGPKPFGDQPPELAGLLTSGGCECRPEESAVSPLAYLKDLLDYSIQHLRVPLPGLSAAYSNQIDMSNALIFRTDDKIDFKWPAGTSAAAGIEPDTFSVRWTGNLQPLFSEAYTFSAVSNGGVRIWIDGELIIDNWAVHPTSEDTGSITLTAGELHDIKVEFFQQSGDSVVTLFWSSPSQSKEVVPQNRLFSKITQQIDLQFLVNNLYQPFGHFSFSAALTENLVRQVRICIEVLRKYLQAQSKPSPGTAEWDALTDAETNYRMNAYTALLKQSGTSYEELRQFQRRDDKARQAFAERIGIDFTGIDASPDSPKRLDALLLDPTAPPDAPNALTQEHIENLFGLVSTSIDRDPLAEASTSRLQVWRLERLRTLWKQQDWPDDPFIGHTLPLVDPDLIGPDDLRKPLPGMPAFDIWEKRRNWVDNQLNTLRNMTHTVRGELSPDISAMVAYLAGEIQYDPVSGQPVLVRVWPSDTSKNDLTALKNLLGNKGEDALSKLDPIFHISIEAFTRLMEVMTTDDEWQKDERNPAPTPDVWEDLYSILTQCMKVALNEIWCGEEQSSGINMSPVYFWKSLREPAEGTWPLLHEETNPWLDPDTAKEVDLPDSSIGQYARDLLQARKSELQGIFDEIKTLREADPPTGFENICVKTFGNPPTGSCWSNELDSIKAGLVSSDETIAAAARERLETQIRLTAEDFNFLMLIKVKDAKSQADPGKRPTAEDWSKVYHLLAQVEKVRACYPLWIQEEDSLPYWKALKAKTPRWRTVSGSRERWQQALETSGSAPLIDPDLIHAGCLATPFPGNSAFDLWDDRRSRILECLESLRTTREGEGFGPLISAAIEVEPADLAALAQKKSDGEDISRQLEHLTLTGPEFALFDRIRNLAEAGQTILGSEWDEVYAVLAEVWKRRLYATWRKEEKEGGLSLSPDWFQIPSVKVEAQITPSGGQLAARARKRVLQDWQDTLQARIDQEQAIIQGLRDAVSAAEEYSLPALRDALIMASDAVGNSLEAKASRLAGHLLLDTTAGGCQRTTRVAQAIETIQGLLWSAQTGHLYHNGLSLVLEGGNFDEEWKYLGSYAQWRTPMFVFMYPENILIPSLRKNATPAFYELVDSLRGKNRVEPNDARAAAKSYVGYINDVISLVPEASCRAVVKTDKGWSDLLFTFARAGSTGKVYWLACDVKEACPADGQYWTKVKELQNTNVFKIIGAVPYYRNPEDYFIYLFVDTLDNEGQKLQVLKIDPSTGNDIGGLKELDLPDEVKYRFTVAICQHEGALIPPRMIIQTSNGAVYQQELAGDNNEWAQLLPENRGDAGHKIQAVIGSPADGCCLFAADSAGDISYRIGLNSGPALSRRPDGCLSIFIRGADNDVWFQMGDMSFFPSPPHWICLGGYITSDPAAVWQSNDRLDVFAKGLHNDIQHKWLQENTWSNWESIPGPPAGLASGPAVCRWRSQGGGLNLVVCGADNALWHRWGDGNDWSNWESLGGIVTSDPEVASWADGRLDIFARGPENHLWHLYWQDGSEWSGWKDMGGALNSGPAVCSQSPGWLDVFVRGFDGQLWHKWTRDSGENWSEWTPRGYAGNSDPAAAIWSFGDIYVYTRLNGSYITGIHGSEDTWSSCSLPFTAEQPGTYSEDVAVTPSISPDKNDGWVPLGKGQFAGALDWPADGLVYSFINQGAKTECLITSGGRAVKLPEIQGGPSIIAPCCGHWPGLPVQPLDQSSLPITCAYPESMGVHFATLKRAGVFSLSQPATISITPSIAQPIEIAEQVSRELIEPRKEKIEADFAANEDGIQSLDTYIEELYYFVPMHLALQLHQSGYYQEALDLYCTVYNYNLPLHQRKIYPPLREEESLLDIIIRSKDWLNDPMNPHLIASTRHDAYTRYTQFAIVRCLHDYADSEFAHDTAESISRARMLYQSALDLLESPELKSETDPCHALLDNFGAEIGKTIKAEASYMLPVWEEIKETLAAVTPLSALADVIANLRPVLGEGPWPERLARAHTIVEQNTQLRSTKELRIALQDNAARLVRLHTELARSPIIALAGRVASTKAQQLTLPAIPGIPPGSIEAIAGKFKKWSPGFAPAPNTTFCIPPNPMAEMLRLHARLNLFKIQDGRNISGMKRELEPYSAPTDVTSGMPVIGSGGQLVIPGAVALQTSPYRYKALIERAKELVRLASQIESAMLSAIERRDSEAYNLLKARQDIRIARAGVKLQNLRVTEARDGVALAELQQQRAQIQADHYQEMLDEEINFYEQQALDLYEQAAMLLGASADTSLTAVFLPSSFTDMGVPIYSLQGSATAYAGSLSSSASSLSTLASYWSMQAGIEQRRREWELQHSLALEDVLIGAQQQKIANDHVRIAEQEKAIADIQVDNAETIANFLDTKFTNTDLYEWMSGILERIYNYFLQQATAMARLAADALALERQETPPVFIQADYWQAPSDNGTDRRGVTGSTRLTQDIYQLDQYAFTKDQRKLQLSKTISLARLAPVEFKQFQETGVITFATPMGLFDRDFPGHYLRLIRRVRTSVIALIPPMEGIRATLSTTGSSRVVIGPDIYQTIVIHRGPESVALTSPRDASGLFELETQAEMLLPFEGMGADAIWEFRMPRAANPIDYRTISDVLLTIEYTALDSYDYRRQVLETLDSSFNADRAYSFRHQFPDQWYDLHNSDQSSSPLTVRFQILREDFPPNVEDMRIKHLALCFTGTEKTELEEVVLAFKEQDKKKIAAGGASTIEGIISTRRGSAPGWLSLIGKVPIGEWELTLPNSAEVRQQFKNEKIEDILFVISYSGRTPEWPPS